MPDDHGRQLERRASQGDARARAGWLLHRSRSEESTLRRKRSSVATEASLELTAFGQGGQAVLGTRASSLAHSVVARSNHAILTLHNPGEGEFVMYTARASAVGLRRLEIWNHEMLASCVLTLEAKWELGSLSLRGWIGSSELTWDLRMIVLDPPPPGRALTWKERFEVAAWCQDPAARLLEPTWCAAGQVVEERGWLQGLLRWPGALEATVGVELEERREAVAAWAVG